MVLTLGGIMINPTKLGLAGGILWGFSIFICTILSLYTGYSKEFLEIITGVYPGYTISGVGSVVGLIYGFFDGFVGLYLLAWLYNKF